MEPFSPEDLYQNPHSLSHSGKIILFTCNQDPACNGSERNWLNFRSFSFAREVNAFLKATEGTAAISRKLSAHVDIVTCNCAVDVQTRVKTPFVLVTKKSEKGGSFQYSLLSLNGLDRLEPCIEFKLPYQMQGNVRILQGPTVLWSHDQSVFYTSPNAKGVRMMPIQMSKCVFGEIHTHKGQIFALGLSEAPLTNQYPTLGYFLEKGQVFEGSLILPHPYICITQCMQVLTADRVDDVLRCVVIAATSHQQLVLFENGLVKETCELPFEQAEDIQIVNTGRNGCLFVVFFKQGHVCSVWKDTFQIASCWSDVGSVHVDDFLGCGTEQMLLLLKNQGLGKEPLENVLLTDLCGISYSCGQGFEGMKTRSPPQESSLLTLRALESRLQSGLIVLQELESELRVKDRVLQQSIQVLTATLSGRETFLSTSEQEGLVALWDSDEEESNDKTLDDRMHETPAPTSKPKIDKLWHRIADDQLVVGLILNAESDILASGVSLSLLTEPGQSLMPAVIQTRSQVFWLPALSPSTPTLSSSSSSNIFLEPPAKRSKQHLASNDLNVCRLAVTAATKLTPLLTSGSVKCHAMLHYKKGEALFPGSNPTTAVLHCGDISVDIHDICLKPLLQNPQVKTDEVREDLLSLLTVLDHWVLHIDSPDYSLGDLDGWIRRRENFKKIEVSPEYLLLDSPGPSVPMLLRWYQMNPFQGDLSIHSSQLQMLQFLDSMLTFLPESCFIRPVNFTRSQSTAQEFASTLEKEVLSLREGLSSLLCGKAEEERNEAHTGHGGIPETGSAQELVGCTREVWQQNVERSRLSLSPLVDVKRYREMIQRFLKVKMDADLAGVQQAHMNLVS